MAVISKRVIIGIVTSVCMIATFAAQADDGPEVSLQARQLPLNSIINDTIIAYGKVTYTKPHAGMRLWLDATPSTKNVDQYILSGENKDDNKFKVRIRARGSKPDTLHNNGIVIDSSENVLNFEIVSHGLQKTHPDIYAITVLADALEE
ncbi:AfaD family invasin [Enterobacter chuandaensis]